MDLIYDIAKEAEFGFKRLGKPSTPANWKSYLETTLYENFTKNSDKRKFLLIFNRLLQEELEEHQKQCFNFRTNKPCHQEKNFEVVIFAIDQVLDDVPEYIDKTADSFTTQEQIFTSNKLDEILENFKRSQSYNEMAFGILYDEIQELKGMTNLGKKNWKQLALGKIADLMMGATFDATVGNSLQEAIQNTISHTTLPSL